MGPDKLIDILLVEDNPGDVELTKSAFENCTLPNRVFVVNDGEEAMDFLHNRNQFAASPRPDFIMLDLNLPKLNGQEVLAQIKQNDFLKTIPVVILTSSEAERDIARSYNLHANCFVTKPVDVEKFLDVVKSTESFWLSVVTLPPDEKTLQKAG